MVEKKKREKLTATEERFLNYIIDNEIKQITPINKNNEIIFTQISGFKTPENENIQKLLHDLTEKGYFIEQEFDRSILCPNCKSVNVYSKLNCPRCDSKTVNRHELIEHPNCGFIGGVSELKRTSTGYLCPNCGGVLRNKKIDIARMKTDYLVIGSSYSCDSCGHKFDKPNTSFSCQNCGAYFDFKQAEYEKSYQYNITAKIEEIIPTRAIRDMIRITEEILQESNFQVELQKQLTGKSGEIRNFDIYAEKNNKKIVIDISSWGNKEDLTKLLGKKMDITVESTILIDISGKNLLESMGNVYGIKIFNGRSDDFKELFKEYLNSIHKEKQESKGFFSSLIKKEEN